VMKVILCWTLGCCFLGARSLVVQAADDDNNNIREGFCFFSVKQEMNELVARLTKVENDLKRLQETPRIAFSAILCNGETINLGNFNTKTTIVYPKVLTNMGGAYNSATGIFTAFVKGTYYFSFTVFLANAANLYVNLMKNSQHVVSMWDTQSTDLNDSGTNSAVLELEVGDQVYVRLNENRQLYEDNTCYNSFSGFLLFPA
uniref:C1q domain-containing protein n=1 Tax=Lepisosteus oculatus TaxID=7918 RepID=W5NN48_LEPOC